MEKFLYPNLSALSDVLKNKRLIVIGEMHGINENAAVMRAVLNLALASEQAVCLAFEWMLQSEEIEALQQYVAGGSLESEIPEFFIDSDGRVTAGHIELLEYCRSHNMQCGSKITLATFDLNDSAREETMARLLTNVAEKHDGVVVAEMGVTHARRAGEGSLADLLPESLSLYSIFLEYRSGSVAVEGEIYDVGDSFEQQRGPRNHFDAAITVERATPSSEGNLLTALQRLYSVKLDQH